MLSVPTPFDLHVVVHGHGWFDLAPHTWLPAPRRFETAIQVGRQVADVGIREHPRGILATVATRRSLARAERARAAKSLARMLRSDDDLEPFWARCRASPMLAWVPRRGAGRLLRSPSLFEDLFKILATTNCSWAATRGMISRVVEALGAPAPSGRRAFPTAAACARQPERFYRQVVRAGYRARAMRDLAVAFASGRVPTADFEAADLPTDDLRARLLALSGFGPYAAGQAMRLLGRYDDLALDAWCRAELASRRPRGRPPTDRAIERAYSSFGPFRGLALWMDLTARWHGEPAAPAPATGAPNASDAAFPWP